MAILTNSVLICLVTDVHIGPTSVVWLASASNHRAFYDSARPGCKPITKELYVG